jgi:hypothetical protein
MSGQNDPQERIRQIWQNEILGRIQDTLEHNTSPSDRSALYACVPDCYQSMQKICNELMPALARTMPTDYATLHDLFSEIGGVVGELEHIRSHVDSVRGAFDVLLRALAHKADASRQSQSEAK